jgi:hypothetical protein
VLAALVLSALVAGCGGDEGEGDGDTAGHTPSVTSEDFGLRLDLIATVRHPTYVTDAPQDPNLLFVTEQPGRVRVIEDGDLVKTPFLDIRHLVNDEGSEQGLFSIALAPDFSRSGRFYVHYTDKKDDVHVEEYRRAGDSLRADPNTRRTLLVVPKNQPEHNGGLLLFGPDGNLYVGLGDGGPADSPTLRAQDPNNLLGKILRIDPLSGDGRARPYAIPAGNPFVDGSGREEIFALGFRNPWRFSFDRQTDALIIGDVGGESFEEIDYVPAGEGAGANFGWPEFEGEKVVKKGAIRSGSPVKPVLTYPHQPECSVIGGYVARDPELPELEGRYLYGDACTGEIRSVILADGKAKDDRPLGLVLPPECDDPSCSAQIEAVFGLSSFGEDRAGHLYAVTVGGGVYRFVPDD